MHPFSSERQPLQSHKVQTTKSSTFQEESFALLCNQFFLSTVQFPYTGGRTQNILSSCFIPEGKLVYFIFRFIKLVNLNNIRKLFWTRLNYKRVFSVRIHAIRSYFYLRYLHLDYCLLVVIKFRLLCILVFIRYLFIRITVTEFQTESFYYCEFNLWAG